MNPIILQQRGVLDRSHSPYFLVVGKLLLGRAVQVVRTTGRVLALLLPESLGDCRNARTSGRAVLPHTHPGTYSLTGTSCCINTASSPNASCWSLVPFERWLALEKTLIFFSFVQSQAPLHPPSHSGILYHENVHALSWDTRWAGWAPWAQARSQFLFSVGRKK